MSKVLITGANGFIGSHLVRKFVREGHSVYGLVRTTSDLSLIADVDVSLRYGDISDYSTIEKSLDGMDIVIHNAGLASDWGSLESFRKVNLEGSINVAKAAVKNGILRMVYMSTTAIHGFNLDIPACEDSPLNPVFNYSISKLEAEEWLFQYGKQNDLEVAVIRPGNVYGPGDHTFMEKYMDATVSGKIAYVNRGQCFTCPTYAGNLVDGVYLAAFSSKASGEAFIITDGLHITWKKFTELIAAKLNVSPPKLSVPLAVGLVLASVSEGLYKLTGSDHSPLFTKYRMYNAGSNYHFSIEKAKNFLGFEPLTTLDEAIERTVLWYQQKHKDYDYNKKAIHQCNRCQHSLFLMDVLQG